MDYNLTSNVMIDLLATCFRDCFFTHRYKCKAAFAELKEKIEAEIDSKGKSYFGDMQS
jgi:hypothetical protein